MTIVELVAVSLGSSVITGFVSGFFNRRAIKASAKKTDVESSDLELKGEIRISEFYKKEYQDLIRLYNELEKSHEEEIKERINCRKEIAELQRKYDEVLRQLNLLRVQIEGK